MRFWVTDEHSIEVTAVSVSDATNLDAVEWVGEGRVWAWSRSTEFGTMLGAQKPGPGRIKVPMR